MLSNFLEKDRILSVLSHLRDYIIFSSFPSFLRAFLMIRYAPVNQILGGKSMLRSIRYANG